MQNTIFLSFENLYSRFYYLFSGGGFRIIIINTHKNQ